MQPWKEDKNVRMHVYNSEPVQCDSVHCGEQACTCVFASSVCAVCFATVCVGILRNHLPPSFLDCSSFKNWCNSVICVWKLWHRNLTFETLLPIFEEDKIKIRLWSFSISSLASSSFRVAFMLGCQVNFDGRCQWVGRSWDVSYIRRQPWFVPSTPLPPMSSSWSRS